MKAITIALAAALLATSGAAAAQSATDAQCLILSNAFAKQAKDADQKTMAEDSMYFYLGRVSDRMTATQLKTLLDTQSKTITEASAAEMMNKCVGAIEAKVQLVQSVAKSTAQPKGR